MRAFISIIIYFGIIGFGNAGSYFRENVDQFDGHELSIKVYSKYVRGKDVANGTDASFILRVRKKREELIFLPGLRYLCTATSPLVQFVFDDSKPIEFRAWTGSTDNEAVFASEKVKNSIVLLFQKSKKFSVRFTDHCGHFLEADFFLYDDPSFKDAYEIYRQKIKRQLLKAF